MSGYRNALGIAIDRLADVSPASIFIGFGIIILIKYGHSPSPDITPLSASL